MTIYGLTASPAEIVQQLMVDLSLGSNSDSNWLITINQQPSVPDDMITVYDTEGEHQGRTHADGETQEAFGLQIRVRSVDHKTGYAKARYIATQFDRLVHNNSVTVVQAIGTAYDRFTVYAITRKSGVLYIGKEPSTDRHLFTFNSVVTIQQTS